jgi:hypothetical protein
MKFRPSSRWTRSSFFAAGLLALGLLLAGAFSSDSGKTRRIDVFQGEACLPLSGELAGAGDAFRSGFLEGLAGAADSGFVWRWNWTDNGSDPLIAQAWADSVGRSSSPDLLLAGLGSAIEGVRLPVLEPDSTALPEGRNGFRTKSVPTLLLGDGSEQRPGVWSLWPSMVRMRRHLTELLRDAPRPVVVVVAATGSWADVVLSPELREPLGGPVILPHDLDNVRWDEEIKRLWETRPGSVLFWDRPHEATSLLSRPLARGALLRAKLFVPEGTLVPDSLDATVLAPLWQPASPPDSLQCLRYREWGRRVGESLSRSTRLTLSDTLESLREGFRRLPPSDAFESGTQGWSPRLVAESLAAKRPIPAPEH